MKKNLGKMKKTNKILLFNSTQCMLYLYWSRKTRKDQFHMTNELNWHIYLKRHLGNYQGGDSYIKRNHFTTSNISFIKKRALVSILMNTFQYRIDNLYAQFVHHARFCPSSFCRWPYSVQQWMKTVQASWIFLNYNEKIG